MSDESSTHLLREPHSRCTHYVDRTRYESGIADAARHASRSGGPRVPDGLPTLIDVHPGGLSLNLTADRRRPGRRIAVVVPVVVAWLLVGTLVGGVGVWWLRNTIAVSAGAANPAAAAEAVLTTALGQVPSDDLALGRYLAKADTKRLVGQVHSIRDQLADAGMWLASRPGDRVDQDGEDATVTVDVYAVWFDSDRMLWYEGTPHPWTFHTHHSGGLEPGWRVTTIDAPDPCGTYVKC